MTQTPDLPAITIFDGADPIGEQTLRAIAGADQFNAWMYEAIAPFLQGPVLEIGSGIGNISQHLLLSGMSVALSDLRQSYLDVLHSKFRGFPNLLGLSKINLTDPDFLSTYADHVGQYQTLVVLNVIEHIQDDQLALSNCLQLLRSGGKAVILVPAWQALFNGLDRGLEHYRRYRLSRLQKQMQQAGFSMAHGQYFNCAGIPAWFFSGSVLRKKVIPDGQMGLYNKLVPAFRLLDKLLKQRLGLSAIAVGVKP